MTAVNDRSMLERLVGDRPGGDDVVLRERDGTSYLVIRNEFATVWVGIDRTPNGVRLVVTDAEAATALALDPLELEAVSRMHHRDFDDRILERDGSPTTLSDPARADTDGEADEPRGD